MGAQLTTILDKTNSQQFRISQRLQWAAGANPALNSIVDEFERCMKRRKQILQVNIVHVKKGKKKLCERVSV